MEQKSWESRAMEFATSNLGWFSFVGVIIVGIIYFRIVMIHLIARAGDRLFKRSVKEDAKLKMSEDEAKAKADALIQEASELKAEPVTDEWYKK